MGKITFILGGVRSGKSNYGLKLALGFKRKVAFIATGQALDKEMRERIRKHQQLRPRHWQTFEETQDIAALLKKINNDFPCIIIDCLTLLVSNLLLAGHGHAVIEDKIRQLVAGLKKKKAQAVIIANEVGLGIVPRNKLAREFRDITGRMNQIVAKEADEVVFMVSGIPTKIKGRGHG